MDMSTPLLSEVIRKIDANPRIFLGASGGEGCTCMRVGEVTVSALAPPTCPLHYFTAGEAPVYTFNYDHMLPSPALESDAVKYACS